MPPMDGSSENEIEAAPSTPAYATRATRNTAATTVAITPPHPQGATSPAVEPHSPTDDRTYALHQLLVDALKPDADDTAMERYQLGVESLYASQLVATTAAVRLAAVEQRALDALSEVKKVAAAAMMISGHNSFESRGTAEPGASFPGSEPVSLSVLCSHTHMIQAGNSAAAWSEYLQVLAEGHCRVCKAWAEAERLKFHSEQECAGAIGSRGKKPAAWAVHGDSTPWPSSTAPPTALQTADASRDKDEAEAGKQRKDTAGVGLSKEEPGTERVLNAMLEESRGAANREVETATADMRQNPRMPSSGTLGARKAADDHRQRADQLLDTYNRDGDVRGVIALLKANRDYAVNNERECSTRMSQSSDCRSEHGVAQLVHGRAANRYNNLLTSIEEMERMRINSPPSVKHSKTSHNTLNRIL